MRVGGGFVCAWALVLLVGGCARGYSDDFGASGNGTYGPVPADGGTTIAASSTGSPETTGPGSTGTSSGGSTGLVETSSATVVEESGSSTSTTAGTTDAPATGCSAIDVVLALDGTASAPNGVTGFREDAFEVLVSGLLQAGDGIDDFHLAVIDSCPKPAAFHNYGDAGACSFASGGNYMLGTSGLASDPTCATAACQELATEYGCAMGLSASGYEGQPDQCTDVGETDDDDEQPAFTAAHALLQPENTGFLREDALLFVIALTDEDEQLIGLGTNSEPGTSVEAIAQQIIDAKGGDIEKVVFLGIGGPPGGCIDGPYGAAADAVALRGVTEVFSAHAPSRGIYWNLCDPAGVAGALEQALAIVDTACAEMTPAAP